MSKRTHLPLLLCAFGFGLDHTELQMGGALATIFSSPPYSLDAHGVSWLLSAVFVGACICTPLLGRMADRRGIRRVLGWTLVWLGITTLLSCVRDDPTWLTAFRVLIGISLGAYPPLVIAYLTSIAPVGQRRKWIFWACGLAYIATPFALFALRHLTAAQPAGLAGWRWLSIGIGSLSVLTGLAFRWLPEAGRPPADTPGASQRSAAQMLSSPALKRTFIPVAALYFLYPCTTIAYSMLTGPLLLQRGFTLNHALWYVSFATIWPIVGTLGAAWVADRIPLRVAMLSCCAVMLIATLLFFTSESELALTVALVAFGVAQALYPAFLTTFGAESFPIEVRATATTAAWGLNRLACFLAPLALLPLLGSFGPMSVAACVAAALILSAGITLSFGARELKWVEPVHASGS